MTEWSNFCIAVAGASATLTGLIFVGVSISLTKILSIKGLPERALLSILLLLNVLVNSIVLLIPAQTTKCLGTEVLITGIIVYSIIFRLDLRIFRYKQPRYRRHYALHFIFDHAATVSFIMLGVFLIKGWANGEYWLVPAVLFSIIKAVLDGWVLLVEINR